MAQKNTTLEVGPLSVPVSLTKISVRSDVKIDRASKNGNKIKRQEIDSVTGEVLEGSDVKKGVYEDPKKGSGFREIKVSDLDAIEAETQIDAFTVEKFIPLSEVPWERTQAAYFLGPQSDMPGGAKALKLLYEALKKSKKAGVLKITLTSRQYAAVVYAKNGGVILNTLAFAADFKKVSQASEALAGVEIANKQMVGLMTEFIETLTTEPTCLDEMEDDLVALKQKLVDDALAGKKIQRTAKPKAKQASSGDDALMDALRASALKAKRDKASSGKKAAPVA
jgi:DNA end-binding protein Ku